MPDESNGTNSADIQLPVKSLKHLKVTSVVR